MGKKSFSTPKSNEQKSSELNQKYQELAQGLIDAIQDSITTNNVESWRKGWVSEPMFNPQTGTRYQGYNRLALALSARRNQYTDPRWITFKGIVKMGEERDAENEKRAEKGLPALPKIHLKKGSKATTIKSILNSQSKVDDVDKLNDWQKNKLREKDGEFFKEFTTVKWVPVFNLSCVEGVEPFQRPNTSPIEVDKSINELSEAMKLYDKLTMGECEDVACYIPSQHKVLMPPKNSFHSNVEYQSTLLHEFVHASSKTTEREITGRFGSPDYAREELVAELGAVFMASDFGLDYDSKNHQAYLTNWIQVLTNDPLIIKTVMYDCQKSCDLLNRYRDQYVQEITAKAVQENTVLKQENSELVGVNEQLFELATKQRDQIKDLTDVIKTIPTPNNSPSPNRVVTP